MAQTTAEVTTTVIPEIIAPPAGTLSVMRPQNTVSPDGAQTITNETTHHNGNGFADDEVTKTTRYPPVDVMTTKKSTSSVTE